MNKKTIRKELASNDKQIKIHEAKIKREKRKNLLIQGL
jgi:hypothetical protein